MSDYDNTVGIAVVGGDGSAKWPNQSKKLKILGITDNPERPFEIPSSELTFASANTAMATVDSNGVVSGVYGKVGSTLVHATVTDKPALDAYVNISVRPIGADDYLQKAIDILGANLIGYWGLWEQSGTTINDASGNGRTGTYTGLTLNNLVTANGLTAPYFPGTAADANVFGAGLASAFNGAEGTVMLWVKGDSVATWTAATSRTIIDLFVNASNVARIKYDGTRPNKLAFSYVANSVNGFKEAVNFYPTGWVCLGITWSDADNIVKFYNNGVKFAEYANPGTWAGTPTRLMIGARAAAEYFNGWISDVFIGSRAITEDEARTIVHAASRTNMKVMTVIGDSFTATSSVARFPEMIQSEYNSGQIALINHAVGGQSITGYLATEVTAAANDDADIIYMEMGGNDGGNADLSVEDATTMRLVLEEQLAILKVSNPRAQIFFMNVGPMWDETNAYTEIIKTNVRAAIALGCSNAGIPCWDSYTDPWWLLADTLDGKHLNASTGSRKVVDKILPLLPVY